jgi:hypothetical protein
MAVAATQLAPPDQGAAARRTAAGLGRRPNLSWRRLAAPLELATIGAGYGVYTLIRDSLPATRQVALAHASQIWRAEQWLHINIEPALNHLVARQPVLADAIGYYYGLCHFIVTPLVLAWLYLRRPASFPRMRSALVLATMAALVVFWAWPLAPPRFAVPAMTDILVAHNILGAANPHGVTGLADLYAAMPSLHVAWAVWCAVAVVTATRTRWRHLAWLYPAATVFAVLASANHFILDATAGAAVIALALLVTGRRPSAAVAADAADAADGLALRGEAEHDRLDLPGESPAARPGAGDSRRPAATLEHTAVPGPDRGRRSRLAADRRP